MKKAIAMKCSQKDWDSIKGKFTDEQIGYFTSFDNEKYLANDLNKKGIIANIPKSEHNQSHYEFIETFNAKIFLNACGIDFDVYEISKEQIINLHKSYCLSELKDDLEMMFPDAFKKELEVGKWYRCNYTDSIIAENKSLIFISEIDGKNINGYGFDFNGSWFDKKRDCGTINEHYQEATPQEVETALINEAKKRGYLGNCIKLIEGFTGSNSVKLTGEYIYENYKNRLIVDLHGCVYTVFKNGKWATIIETISKEEAEKLLNKKII